MRVAGLFRYPVKGLTGQPLDRVAINAGEGVPHDRRYAIAHGSTRFENGVPHWQSKDHFVQLMRSERLARLDARYDSETGALEIFRDGGRVARGRLDDPMARQLLDQFFAAFLAGEARGAPRIVRADKQSFSDVPQNVLSIVNLASVKDLERVARAPIDPRRFRANVHLDGAAAWREMDWPGRSLRLGDTVLRIVQTIPRCAAIDVNPATGRRDLNLVKALMDGYRRDECGVYAEVIEAGEIAIGDEAELI